MTKEKLAKLRAMGLVFDDVFEGMVEKRDKFNVEWEENKKKEKKLIVTQIEGPFNDQNNLVSYLSKEHAYYYLASLNQKVSQENIKEIKWAVSYDDNEIDKAYYLFSGGTIDNGKVRVDIQISKGDNGFKIYAYTGANLSKRNGFVEALYKKVVVLFVGGAADKEKFAGKEATGIIGDIKLEFVKEHLENKQYISSYLGYNEIYGEDRINKNVIPNIPNKEGTEIFIIGHSLGGWNGAHLSQKLKAKGYDVNLLITLDPVGARNGTTIITDMYRDFPTPKSRFWIDIYTNPDKNEVDDYIAGLGGQWLPKKTEPNFFFETKLHHGDASGMLNEFIKDAGASAYTFLTNQMTYYLFLQ